MKMIGKELLTIGVLVAILLSAGAGSVYAHKGTDDNKPLMIKIKAEDGDKVTKEWSLKVMVVGPDGKSLKGNGHYKVKSDDGTEVRNFQIKQSLVTNEGHYIALWSDDALNIVISITDGTQPTVNVISPIGQHQFASGTFELEANNL